MKSTYLFLLLAGMACGQTGADKLGQHSEGASTCHTEPAGDGCNTCTVCGDGTSTACTLLACIHSSTLFSPGSDITITDKAYCEQSITFGHSSKAIKDIFPEECAPAPITVRDPVKYLLENTGGAPKPSEPEELPKDCHLERYISPRTLSTEGNSSDQYEWKQWREEDEGWHEAKDLRIVCAPQTK